VLKLASYRLLAIKELDEVAVKVGTNQKIIWFNLEECLEEHHK
jgi:hypothetical protein